MHKLPARILLLAIFLAPFLVLAALVRPALAEKPPDATPAEVRSALPDRLHELDSPDYETRCLAARCLERWIGSPDLAQILAEEFQRTSLEPQLSMEVRWRLDRWRNRLPTVHVELPRIVSPQELERLVAQLDDDSYAVRAGASQRLQWLATSEAFSAQILVLLKRRLADPALSQDSFFRIEEVRRTAWGTWLESESDNRFLPPVSVKQIEQWLDDIAQPSNRRDARSSLRGRVARQGLMDALSQDAEAPRVKTAIEARLGGKLDPDSSATLHELLDLTRPAIVAETWSQHKQTLEQHLIVGQPTQAPGAEHPSYFDNVNVHTAHCASGNALTPGDYPVGAAFPAPRWPQGAFEAVFDLVYLPTARRQIAYSYYVKTDPAARLAKLSRRTLDRFLGEKAILNDSQLGMLAQLDAHEVSRFAGRYFFVVEDGIVEEPELDSEYSTSRKHLGGQSGRFSSICGQLALDGTRDALPGLIDAIRQKRFLSPTPQGPYRQEWLAAFSIAKRDPWPEVDGWLAENIENRQTLSIDHNEAPEIGATAAAALLVRHHQRPEAFGLQTTVEAHMLDLKIPGYRYAADEDIDRVRKWWAQQAQTEKKAAAITK